MALTVNQLASELISEQSERLDDSGYVSQVEKWIKDSIIEITNKATFKIFWKEYSFDTVAGAVPADALYSLPEDFEEFKYVRLTTEDNELDYINPRRLTGYELNLEEIGRPRNWWLSTPVTNDTAVTFVQRIRLYPIPNGVYTVNAPYYFNPRALVSASAIPMTDSALICLKSRLRMQMHKFDQNLEMYNIERAQFSQDFNDLVSKERKMASRVLVAQQTDLPRRSARPRRLRYPFE